MQDWHDTFKNNPLWTSIPVDVQNAFILLQSSSDENHRKLIACYDEYEENQILEHHFLEKNYSYPKKCIIKDIKPFPPSNPIKIPTSSSQSVSCLYSIVFIIIYRYNR
jgi:hypothetical protein